ncbi:secretion-regulating guanine nucleotide exchange factor isoform X3 [Prionailurus viverrinus]|uniref:secretion-regulating guanine nucleotide exchange factor isoform X3 n=1 Tax=Prionailurus viverrinus TaxID=61388 RepID=UPI001FF6F91D|nr:secretion-regulating guanine nucleotide exchange factor isoform X3 [Prionailurus viverrinus]
MEREPRASEAAPEAAVLFAWGANSYGQLGLGHKEDVLLPQQLNDFCKPECVRRITGGGGHSAIVTDEGGLFVCGLNKDGQLGLGHTEDVLYFTTCRSLLGCPVQQVACGWDFTIILTENGQVLSCGSNSFGQLGVPHGPRRCVVPQAIELLKEKVVCIAAGLRHALAATASGIVFQWGTGLASSGRRLCPGQTLPLFLTAKEPSRVTGLENSKATCVLAGSDHSASLTDAGELYVWGSNKHGQLASLAAFLPLPQKIEAHCFQNEKVTSVWSGWTHLVAQTETGRVFTWGRADYGQLGRKLESREGWKLQSHDSSLPCSGPQKSMPSCLHCLTGAAEVSCGSEHNLAVIGGTCYSWGWNEHGMCGDGSEANIWAPQPVPSLQSSPGLLVGCGAGHSLALCQLPALPALGQHPKVTGPSPDAAESAKSQEAMDRETRRKDNQKLLLKA